MIPLINTAKLTNKLAMVLNNCGIIIEPKRKIKAKTKINDNNIEIERDCL